MSDNQWTWLSGSQDINQKGAYGHLTIASPLNVPGGRDSHSMSLDPSRNLLYIFGGLAFGSSDVGMIFINSLIYLKFSRFFK